MALRKIAQVGHPILRERAREVTREELLGPEVQGFIDDLVATMRDASGAGLAATQLYMPLRICAIEVGNNPRYPYKPKIPLTILVNPVVTPLSDETFSNFEGCLSVPNLRGRVQRYLHVKITGWDRRGEPQSFEAKGISAGTYQHELDHLDGKLFLDRVSDPTSLCTWEHFDRYEKDRFVAEVKEIVARWGS